jgi:excisionase family DNA binding protein
MNDIIELHDDNLEIPAFYTINQAIKSLGIGRTHIYKLIAEGELKAKRIGVKTVILRSEIKRFMSELPDWKPREGWNPRNGISKKHVG